MNHSKSITGVTISHNTTELHTVEKTIRTTDTDRMTELHADQRVSECIILQTCTRVEAYVVTESHETGKDVLNGFFNDVAISEVGEWLPHSDCIRHLMRVSAGIESIVIGEDNILGQLKTVYNTATEQNTIGDVLDPVVLKAIHVGQTARSETTVNEGIVSISSAAIHAVEPRFEQRGSTALVIGAGDVAHDVITTVSEHTNRVIISNRTIDNAIATAGNAPSDTQTAVIALQSIPQVLSYVDVVITATGSEEFVITESSVPSDCDAVFVDIAQPRDVDPEITGQSGVSRVGIEDLHSIQQTTRQERREAVRDVERLIGEAYTQFTVQRKRERADGVVKAMYAGAEQIKQEELDEAIAALANERETGDVTTAEKRVLESFADSLVNQLLAAPTDSLRDAAENDEWETIATAIKLFNPETSDDTEPRVSQVPRMQTAPTEQ